MFEFVILVVVAAAALFMAVKWLSARNSPANRQPLDYSGPITSSPYSATPYMDPTYSEPDYVEQPNPIVDIAAAVATEVALEAAANMVGSAFDNGSDDSGGFDDGGGFGDSEFDNSGGF